MNWICLHRVNTKTGYKWQPDRSADEVCGVEVMTVKRKCVLWFGVVCLEGVPRVGGSFGSACAPLRMTIALFSVVNRRISVGTKSKDLLILGLSSSNAILSNKWLFYSGRNFMWDESGSYLIRQEEMRGSLRFCAAGLSGNLVRSLQIIVDMVPSHTDH